MVSSISSYTRGWHSWPGTAAPAGLGDTHSLVPRSGSRGFTPGYSRPPRRGWGLFTPRTRHSTGSRTSLFTAAPVGLGDTHSLVPRSGSRGFTPGYSRPPRRGWGLFTPRTRHSTGSRTSLFTAAPSGLGDTRSLVPRSGSRGFTPGYSRPPRRGCFNKDLSAQASVPGVSPLAIHGRPYGA